MKVLLDQLELKDQRELKVLLEVQVSKVLRVRLVAVE